MMKAFIKGFSRLTEAIAGGMLAAIFLIFLLQILLRYFFTPAGWTLELIGILWVWVIFFSCAFIVRERDHVKFDIIYLSRCRCACGRSLRCWRPQRSWSGCSTASFRHGTTSTG